MDNNSLLDQLEKFDIMFNNAGIDFKEIKQRINILSDRIALSEMRITKLQDIVHSMRGTINTLNAERP
jgi:hypothetical protein